MRHRSGTHFATHVEPCSCLASADDGGVHGFTLEGGVREGMYLAALRDHESVNFIDLAVSGLVGTIALRIWVDVATQAVRCRLLAPDAVPGHPALTLGSWLAPIEVHALGYDLDLLTARIVSGDERLWVHLCDASERLTRHHTAANETVPSAGNLA